MYSFFYKSNIIYIGNFIAPICAGKTGYFRSGSHLKLSEFRSVEALLKATVAQLAVQDIVKGDLNREGRRPRRLRQESDGRLLGFPDAAIIVAMSGNRSDLSVPAPIAGLGGVQLNIVTAVIRTSR